MASRQREILVAIETLARAAKRGAPEKFLAIAAAGALAALGTTGALDASASGMGLERLLTWTRIALAATALITIALLGLRVFLRATPDALGETSALQPLAIKGPMAFGPMDGELFRQLGREAEIRQLLGFVLDDQVGLAVVMGESGSGKTSLLRAGLVPTLTSLRKDLTCIYWEARAADPLNGLLRACLAAEGVQSEGEENDSTVLSKLLTDRRPKVIIVDQLEQLDPALPANEGFFAILRSAGQQLPPHHTTWIVAFRRQFDPEWRDFELATSGFAAPMLSLKLFSHAQARRIAATIANASGFSIAEALLSDLLGAISQDGRVSPADLGIAAMLLHELVVARKRPHLSLDDYRFAGGSTGLLTDYITSKLERIPATDRPGVLKLLVGLANLETDQRVAHGKDLDGLSELADIASGRLRPYVDYLASPQVRLLETLAGAVDRRSLYRLPHEHLIPALRRLTGVVLAAEDQARVRFDANYRTWNIQSRRSRYLLNGRDLRLVSKYRAGVLVARSNDELAYLSRSVTARRWRGGILFASLLVFAATAIAGREYFERLTRRDREFAQHGVPLDLPSYSRAIQSLAIGGRLTSLDWLSPQLERIQLTGADPAALGSLPRTVREVTIDGEVGPDFSLLANNQELLKLSVRANESVVSVKGLSSLTRMTELTLSELPALKTLSLRPEDFGAAMDYVLSRSEFSLPPSLERLSLLHSTGLEDYRALQTLEHLRSLVMNDTDYGAKVSDTAKLPILSNLTELDISGNPNLQSLEELPELPSLKRLSVGGTGVRALDGVSKYPLLEYLDASRSPSLVDLTDLQRLRNLRYLRLSVVARMDLKVVTNLPSLEQLDLIDNLSLTTLSDVPVVPRLRVLNISGSAIGTGDLRAWPGLERLLIRPDPETWTVDSASPFPALKEIALDLSGGNSPSLLTRKLRLLARRTLVSFPGSP